jgi:hypothetical protein
MTRREFGGNTSTVLIDTTGAASGATVTAYTARTGGTQVTDLRTGDNTATIPFGQLQSDQYGVIPAFLGPDDGTDVLFIDGGLGSRLLLEANDTAARVRQLETSGVGPGTGTVDRTQLAAPVAKSVPIQWATGLVLGVDQLVINTNVIYKTVTAHTAGATFDSSKFQALSAAAPDLSGYVQSIAGVTGQNPSASQVASALIPEIQPDEIGAAAAVGTPIRVSRRRLTDPWLDDNGATPNYTAIRTAKRPIFFFAPEGAGPVWGNNPDQANNVRYGDEHHTTIAPDFDPATIAGLSYYWDPDTIVAADGAPVTSLAASVGGATLASTITLRQPTVQTAGLKRVIQFLIGPTGNDNDELVTTALTSISQPLTMFVVHDTTGTTLQQVVASGVELTYPATGGLSVFAGTTLTKTGITLPDGLGVTIAVVSGSTSKLWRNGGVATTGNAGTAAMGTLFRLGRHPTAGRPFNGNVGKVGIFNRALSLPEVNVLGAGLAAAYSTAAPWATAS